MANPPAKRRLLLLGVGPLPLEDATMLFAPGLRLHALARALEAAGHTIVVGRTRFEQIARPGAAPAPAPSTSSTASTPYTFPLRDFPPEDSELLRRWVADDRIDGVIACTDVIAATAALARLPVPLYVDYNGEQMTERQLQGMRAQNDEALEDGFLRLLPALLGADRFAACSGPQRHALIGQLGLVGRLNRWTAREDLVDAWRPAWPFEFPAPSPDDKPLRLRGGVVPDDAFVILWSGGYNNWADVEGLFAALEQTLELVPNAHFVSTGGAIPGHAEGAFEDFREWVADSPRADRYHFLGWLPSSHMPALYEAADVALNLDIRTYEAELGCRNRLLDWAHFGVIAVTTVLSEISRELHAAGGAVAVDIGDAPGLAAALIALSGDTSRRDALRAAARRFAADWLAASPPEGLLAWAADPRPAPDLPPPRERPGRAFVAPDNRLARAHLDAFVAGGLARHRADLGSRLYRLYRRLRNLRQND